VYKIEFALELVKWLFSGRLVNMMFFPKIFEIYIEKEKVGGAKNYQATRKSAGHNTCVRASGLCMCKEDPLKLFKMEFAKELVKWLLNGMLVKLMFFSENYIQKMQIAGE
jgi:hypothetical protein